MHYFRDCDIRGKYPTEVNEALFYAIGQSVGAKWSNGPLVVGRDVRNGSLELEAALVDGLLYSGAHVIDVGCIPTPILYFARRHYQASVGLMVTASHNPPDYNGLKVLLNDRPAQDADIQWLKANIRVTLPHRPGGSYQTADVVSAYIVKIERFWQQWNGSSGLKRIPRFVADPGGGAWSKVAGRIFKKFGLCCTIVNDQADGNFRGRSPDCAAPSSLNQLTARVLEEQAELGFAWDGDGDRLAVIDGYGAVLTADQIGLILAGALPLVGENILLDVKISRKVSEMLKSLGARPVIEKSAHCVLESAMVEQDCLFGCEYSGHYFFRDLQGADDGMFAALRLLSVLGNYRDLDEISKQLPSFYLTPDIRVSAKAHDFRRLKDNLTKSPFFRDARVSVIDGVKLDLSSGWLLLRRSVSEDKLSFRAEGETASDLNCIVQSVIAALPAEYAELRQRLESWNASNL